MTRPASRFIAVALTVIAAAILSTAIGAAQPADQPQQQQQASTAWPSLETLAERIAALGPTSEPLDYFRAAEDTAALIDSDAGITLARQLYAIAWETDRAAAQPADIGRSVALALAELAPDDDRGWLFAVAASQPPARGAPDWTSPAPEDAPIAASLALADRDAPARLAEALARMRAGEGVRMRALLGRINTEATLRAAGVPASDRSFIIDLIQQVHDEPRCPVCRNERVVAVGSGPNQRYELCPRGGHPGPDLSLADTARVIRVEAVLLGANAQTWSGQAVIDDGRPLRSLDPRAVTLSTGVQPDARVYTLAEGSPLTAITNGSWNRSTGDTD